MGAAMDHEGSESDTSVRSLLSFFQEHSRTRVGRRAASWLTTLCWNLLPQEPIFWLHSPRSRTFAIAAWQPGPGPPTGGGIWCWREGRNPLQEPARRGPCCTKHDFRPVDPNPETCTWRTTWRYIRARQRNL